MTETSADWVERPKPADVAALTTRPVPEPSRTRNVESTALDPRLVGSAVVAVAVLIALIVGRRRRR